MFQHILVPLDGSSRAEQVLPVAARLARASGATIRLLTVVDSAHEAISYSMAGPYMPPDTIERDLTTARSYLDEVSQQFLLIGVSVEKQVDLGNPAAMALLHAEALTERPIDLIVMSSHGYTGFQRWLLGSVAEKIAREAPVPVLILREGESVRFAGMSAIRALVLVDASAWLRARGIEPGHPPRPLAELFAGTIAHGNMYIALVDGQPAAKMALTQEDRLWNDLPGKALYVHGLMVRRAYAGRQIGPALLRWADTLAERLGRPLLRLDCNADNPALRAYYERAGFTPRGEVTLPHRVAARYERAVARRV